MKLFALIFLVALTCSSDTGEHLNEIAAISINEASALEYINGKMWTLEDHGNKSILYSFDSKGNEAAQVLVDAKNNDWESLASDLQGNLYIGDFGNNNNTRKDLVIYKVDAAELKNKKAGVSAVTKFNYPEQKQFPPAKSDRLFDCEAFIEYKGSFYLFTKNRNADSDGKLYVYSIPNKEGSYNARLLGKIKTCSDAGTCAVTGADISPDGKTIMLLTADIVYAITGFKENDFSKVSTQPLYLEHSSQKEGVCFKDNNTLFIVDERKKNTGGKLYEVNITDLKSKR